MKKKGRVYKSMLGSYIMILLIPIFVVVFLYSYTYYTMEGQAEYYTGNLMRTIKGVSDREIAHYKSFLMQLKSNEAASELATVKLDDSPDEYWNSYLIKKELNSVRGTMKESAAYCLDIFVYLMENDKFISYTGAMDMRIYCERFYDISKADQLREVLQNGNMDDVISYKAENGKTYILLLEPVWNVHRTKGKAVAGLWLDMEVLNSRIQSVAWEGGMDWGLLTSQNQFLRWPDKFQIDSLELKKEEIQQQSFVVNGEEYLVNVVESDEYEWSYILFTPEKQVGDSADSMRNLYFICITAIMIIGCWSARVFMRHHYNPLKGLLDILNKDSGNEVKDEYKYLESQMSFLIDKHKDYQKELYKSNKIIKNYVLEEMMTTAGIEEKDAAICEEVYKKFRDGKNLVLLCCIREIEDKNVRLLGDRELERFIIMNLYEEKIGEVFPLEVLEMDNKVVVIADTSQYDEKYTEILKSIHQEMKEFIQHHFDFSVFILEGGCHQGIAGIRTSYLEACEAEAFILYQEDSYIRYEDIRELTVRKYDYSFDMEERLFNAVRACNAKLAYSYIRNILENNFNKEPKPVSDMLTCLLYDIFGTLVKASEERGVRYDKMMIHGHIAVDSSMEEIDEFFLNLVNEICKEDEKKETHGEVLCQKIFEFICKNYTDPELNASQTALHFNMSPSYVSHVYKKYMGESIANVIKKMRVKYAKVLLEEGMSVVEVSQKVGFRECSTFIRTFKSVTGVTPGKIKELAEFEQLGEKKND